jgi:hypothetical protein
MPVIEQQFSKDQLRYMTCVMRPYSIRCLQQQHARPGSYAISLDEVLLNHN